MENTPRERLILTAARLFQEQGFNSTGLNQILHESAVPKGSLYHYFPGGKEDLAVAAIEHSTAEVGSKLQHLVAQSQALLPTLGAVIDYFAHELESSQFLKGCPVATIALEQAGLNAKIQSACGTAYAAWQSALALLLAAHGQKNPAELAERLLVALEGALLLSRARRDCGALTRLKADLPLWLEMTG